jgi:hypothetical protein
MKRGFKTSEAKLSVVVILGQLAAAIFGALPPEYAGVGATVTAVGYAFARGFAKHGGAEAFPALVDQEPNVGQH